MPIVQHLLEQRHRRPMVGQGQLGEDQVLVATLSVEIARGRELLVEIGHQGPLLFSSR
jgi:hypothetical protein